LVALLGTLGGTMGFSVAEEPLLAGLLAPTMAERRFARALGASIWPLRARPMIVDLCQALGCSERQVSRIASAYFRRYHLTVRGWRPFVHAFRLGIAVFLASTGRASAEAIAATVGFSSAVALHHAFSAAGLPTPRALSARDWSATDASGQASSGEIAARSPSGPPLARDRPASVAQRSARSCRMHS
jgi:AraC-like DNA-binding protein